MNRAEFIRTAYAIGPVKLPRSPGGVSGNLDTFAGGAGAHKCLLRFIGDHTTVKKRVRVRHCSAATTLFASGTAFTTAIDISGTGTSGQFAWNIDLSSGVKRYLVVLVSTITTSSTYTVFGDLFYNHGSQDNTPAAAVTAKSSQIGTIGFAQFTAVTA